ncbi:hypothetical protein, partial [Anabaena sp. UHCC 0399]|uniref:hypothetical protein n=1 Tax=Anabaena sp. UHCC 0399 TaxID=3110238 RepID=UPI002B2173B4
MPFSDFTNPYQNPANIPQNYRQHINLRKLFKADGSYVRPAEDPVTMWVLQMYHPRRTRRQTLPPFPS